MSARASSCSALSSLYHSDVPLPKLGEEVFAGSSGLLSREGVVVVAALGRVIFELEFSLSSINLNLAHAVRADMIFRRPHPFRWDGIAGVHGDAVVIVVDDDDALEPMLLVNTVSYTHLTLPTILLV